MSIFNDAGQPIAPDQLSRQGLCPECGGKLDAVDHDVHIAWHWPKEKSPEAARRIELIRAYGRTERGRAAQDELKRIAEADAEARAAAATPATEPTE
jgi:hypothetical protein